MTMSLCVISLMMGVVSPMKTCIMLVMLSISACSMLYTYTSCLFPCCALLLSFSSGMMILFCYCSTMSEYESKGWYSNLFPLAVLGMGVCMVNQTPGGTLGPLKKCMMEVNTPIMLMVMMVVVCSMIAINTCMINPSKTLMSSY